MSKKQLDKTPDEHRKIARSSCGKMIRALNRLGVAENVEPQLRRVLAQIEQLDPASVEISTTLEKARAARPRPRKNGREVPRFVEWEKATTELGRVIRAFHSLGLDESSRDDFDVLAKLVVHRTRT